MVDVGCFHPVQRNTTSTLYKRGWRGISIDMDAVKIEAFNIRRPSDTNLVGAVSDKKGIATCRKEGFFSPFSSLEDLQRAREGGWREVRVETDTLTHFIDSTSYKGRRIDFLSVDTEGHEVPVLRSLDFDRYHPKVVCVETWLESLEEVQQSALYELMTGKGYFLSNWIGLNLMFRYRESR